MKYQKGNQIHLCNRSEMLFTIILYFRWLFFCITYLSYLHHYLAGVTAVLPSAQFLFRVFIVPKLDLRAYLDFHMLY